MKGIFKILVFVLALGVTSLNVACSSDDDDNPEAPVIGFPSNGSTYEVVVGETIDFTFLVEAEGGYESHTLESTTNAGQIISDSSTPGDGAKDFTITGKYQAGDVAGPDGIRLTVVDQEGQESSAIINVDILNN
jgi:hypothetical protein